MTNSLMATMLYMAVRNDLFASLSFNYGSFGYVLSWFLTVPRGKRV